ncbi:MAG: hypothetical protein SOS98_03935 [Varibaculum sp.]|nr:hypothetical protein [Varibaculum sp.]
MRRCEGELTIAEQNAWNSNRSIVNTVLVVPIILILLVTALIVVLITGGLNTNHASVANGVTTLVKKTVVVEIPADQMIEGRSDFPP